MCHGIVSLPMWKERHAHCQNCECTHEEHGIIDLHVREGKVSCHRQEVVQHRGQNAGTLAKIQSTERVHRDDGEQSRRPVDLHRHRRARRAVVPEEQEPE